jgi:hypothetical protein
MHKRSMLIILPKEYSSILLCVVHASDLLPIASQLCTTFPDGGQAVWERWLLASFSQSTCKGRGPRPRGGWSTRSVHAVRTEIHRSSVVGGCPLPLHPLRLCGNVRKMRMNFRICVVLSHSTHRSHPTPLLLCARGCDQCGRVVWWVVATLWPCRLPMPRACCLLGALG